MSRQKDPLFSIDYFGLTRPPFPLMIFLFPCKRITISLRNGYGDQFGQSSLAR
jgi:hypothetical protein